MTFSSFRAGGSGECSSNDSRRAIRYYQRLNKAQRKKLAEVCESRTPPVAYTCDAEVLKAAAVEQINQAHHAAALGRLEESLLCKPDPYVVQLAFIEACAVENPAKAKLYFRKLSPSKRTKLAQHCIRRNVAYE